MNFRSERHFALSDWDVHMEECPPCTGNCNQGRACPVRQACAMPEVELAPIKPSGRMALVLAVLIVALLAALIFGAKQ